MTVYDEQFEVIRNRPGFIAALDQSGGSTPKALAAYGVGEDAWSNDEEMFQVVHQMRTRIIKSPSFSSQKIVGAMWAFQPIRLLPVAFLELHQFCFQ